MELSIKAIAINDLYLPAGFLFNTFGLLNLRTIRKPLKTISKT
jgi:hypothetical protein